MNIVEPIRSKEDIRLIKIKLRNNNIRDYILFTLGINTGLRISDLLSLNVGHVKDKQYLTIIEKKTKKHRKIFLNDKLKHKLDLFVKDRDKTEPLFMSKTSKRLDSIQVHKILKRVCYEVNKDINVSTHTLRKTFGYWFYKRYNNVVMLQKILNHSSVDITLRYIGIEDDEINECFKKFYL